MSVAMLSTHQVDFVWQTSILSSNTFQMLTQWLAYLPHHIGFPVPTSEQIQQSYLGASDLLDAENRRLAWSSLLISSLLLYGVLPRLVLYLVMSHQFKLKSSQYQLDLSAPYYVQLRQLLKPNKTNLGVTDTDKENNRHNDHDAIFNSNNKAVFPAYFYPIAIELSGRQHSLAEGHLSQYSANYEGSLLNVCDYGTQQQILADLKHQESKTLVIYVALSRLPDRGLKRFIAQLTSPDRTVHLAMLIEQQQSVQRDSDWYRLARDVGIELDNILHIEVNGDKHE